MKVLGDTATYVCLHKSHCFLDGSKIYSAQMQVSIVELEGSILKTSPRDEYQEYVSAEYQRKHNIY